MNSEDGAGRPPAGPARNIPGAVGWRTAMADSLYGADGFFRREAPRAHFRTSVHASPLFAVAVVRLLRRVDDALGAPDELALVDVGGGRGELLRQILHVLAAGPPDGDAPGPKGLGERLRPAVVERAPRPENLDPRIGWLERQPPPGTLTGLVLANEWLDNVPLDVVTRDAHGRLRYVYVDPSGEEAAGPPVREEDAAWLRRWWPLVGAPGERAEVGRPRDTAWSAAVRSLRRGVAVAVDYGHTRATRPPLGTLTGYRDGRSVPPVPDGSCDLTAHVALDACAAGAGGPSRTLTQREALHLLGVRGSRPPLSLASTDPAAYVRALQEASEAGELTDPAGLGSFTWLIHPVAVPDPFVGDERPPDVRDERHPGV